MKYPQGKFWTHKIPTRKYLGPTHNPREKILDPQRYDGTVVQDPWDPWWHKTQKILHISMKWRAGVYTKTPKKVKTCRYNLITWKRFNTGEKLMTNWCFSDCFKNIWKTGTKTNKWIYWPVSISISVWL